MLAGYMREETKKVKWLCVCCHSAERTSTAGQQRGVKKKSSQRAKDARVHTKQAYVDARKVAIGKCQYPECPRRVTLETARAFAFDHRDPTAKATHDSHPEWIHKSAPGGGVTAIVSNMAASASLDKVEEALDAEMDKCDLLCHCCHGCRKPAKRARWDAR